LELLWASPTPQPFTTNSSYLPTPAPSHPTPPPTLQPSNTLVPTPLPIPWPTVSATPENVVYTQNRLQSLISSYTSLILGADIYLTSHISIYGIYSLLIDGDGYKIDGQNSVRCLYVAGVSTNIYLTNLVITNGNSYYGGGLLVMTDCFVSLSNSSIVANSGTYGGGIRVYYATLEMDGCSVGNNDADTGGGGISSYGTGYVTTIKNSLIYSNSATYGGGSYVYEGTMILENTQIYYNYAVKFYFCICCCMIIIILNVYICHPK
jgi:hypothetical protein